MPKVIEQYNSILNENVTADDNYIYFDWTNSGTDGIITKIKNDEVGFDLRTRNPKILNGVSLHYLYEFDTYKPNVGAILRAIKGKDKKYKIKDEDLQKFAKISAMYASRFLNNEKIDVVLTVSNPSFFLESFINELQKRSFETKMFSHSIVKRPIADVIIHDPNGKLNDYELKELQGMIDKAKERGEHLKLSRDIYKFKYRYFVKNFIGVEESVIKDLIGKRVCVIDDTFTSGNTLANVLDVLREQSIEYLSALTIFKIVKDFK